MAGTVFTMRPLFTFNPKVEYLVPPSISQSTTPSKSSSSVNGLMRRICRLQCCSSSPNGSSQYSSERGTPQLIKIAVSGITELLRIFSPLSQSSQNEVIDAEKDDDISVSSMEDIVEILKSDYEKAYFVTGVFSSEIYVEDCIFEDPTIRFRGKDLYERNLKLLVPFFDCPSIVLKNIEEGKDSEKKFILATWKLRTYLNLPWRPLISIDGKTIYNLDDDFQIVRHAESWNVSPLEAIGQIFTPPSNSERIED